MALAWLNQLGGRLGFFVWLCQMNMDIYNEQEQFAT